MPNHVDLRSAEMEVSRKKGIIKIVDADEDRVDIRISDIPRGENTYKFDVRFGTD
ncbi:hypothetical protein N8553_03480 [bacterium]|jgi:hypothetical protein|nr:hypothetical protein [Planctomicrobium sp.]MDA7504023.1 hypothetical protein [bacterium]